MPGGKGELLHIHVDEVLPTQEAVGMIEVREKASKLEALDHDGRKEFLEARPVPAVRAQENKLYMIDHHHLARAVHEIGHNRFFLRIVEDFSAFSAAAFWREMESRQLVYLFNEHGKPIEPADLPKHVAELRDDPYRSLAGEARRAGAFDKDETPFAEFKWADFFRKRLKILPGKEGFEAALAAAIALAKTPAANGLPGYKNGAKG
jgi:hypothetical protein